MFDPCLFQITPSNKALQMDPRASRLITGMMMGFSFSVNNHFKCLDLSPTLKKTLRPKLFHVSALHLTIPRALQHFQMNKIINLM